MPLATDPHTARRILVYGVTGSGKSTAAARIGAVTDLPVTMVDELTWLSDWEPVPMEEQRRVIAEITAGDEWVLDSAYSQWLDLVLPRAELVVALDYPRWLSLQRLVRRTVGSAVTGTPRCNGNTESIRNMLGSNSIVRWHFRSFAAKRERMHAWATAADGAPVVLLSSPRELDAWIDRHRARPADHAPG